MIAKSENWAQVAHTWPIGKLPSALACWSTVGGEWYLLGRQSTMIDTVRI